MSIKATSALSIAAIWAAMIPAVAVEGDAWWGLIFAVLGTAAIGVSAWRRLGISRLIAVAGTWAGCAIALGSDSGATWMSVFAFLTTGAIVYSPMRRDALVGGLGIAAAWLMAGAVVAAHGPEGAWIGVFAFLTAGAVASGRGRPARGAAAIAWWGIAGGVMLASGGWYWLSVPAFLLTAISLGISDFRLPRSIEWDLFDRDDQPEAERPRRRGRERGGGRRFGDRVEGEWRGVTFEEGETRDDGPRAVR